jgi:hypothetical protein
VDSESSEDDSTLAKSVSRRMIEQFFTEIEGADRDWQKEDYDFSDKSQEHIITAP